MYPFSKTFPHKYKKSSSLVKLEVKQSQHNAKLLIGGNKQLKTFQFKQAITKVYRTPYNKVNSKIHLSNFTDLKLCLTFYQRDESAIISNKVLKIKR